MSFNLTVFCTQDELALFCMTSDENHGLHFFFRNENTVWDFLSQLQLNGKTICCLFDVSFWNAASMFSYKQFLTLISDGEVCTGLYHTGMGVNTKFICGSRGVKICCLRFLISHKQLTLGRFIAFFFCIYLGKNKQPQNKDKTEIQKVSYRGEWIPIAASSR